MTLEVRSEKNFKIAAIALSVISELVCMRHQCDYYLKKRLHLVYRYFTR